MAESSRISMHALEPGRLGGMLLRHRDELLRNWEARVLEDPNVPAANDLPRPVLYDRIPALVARIIARLAARHPSTDWGERAGRELGSAEDIAREHARQRFTHHYTAGEAVRELSHFRSALLDLCGQHETAMTQDEAVLVHATIDELMTASAQELEQSAIRAREEVLAIVSHDLRNPLNTILLQAQRLRGREAKDIADAGEVLERSGLRMRRLVEDLLMLAKAEAGQISIALAEEDAGRIVRETTDELRAAAARKKVSFVLEAPTTAVVLRCDRERLVQALGNLASNAIKFTPEGGTVRVAVSATDDVCTFAVSDTGPGIAPEHVEDVFRPFWQAPGAPKHGVGLGLAIARGIAEAHGGTLRVARAAGTGSVFVLSVPRAAAPPASTVRSAM